MTVADALFIDTNVLLYANVATAPLHEQALDAIEAAHRAERPLGISRQVLREFIAVRTRPQSFAQLATPQTVVERVHYFEEMFEVADETPVVTEQLLRLLKDYQIGGKQIHDANIVATMLAYGIPALLTHNVKDFERFREIITIEMIV